MVFLRSRTARSTLAILAIGGLLLFALLTSGLPTPTANAATLTRMSPAARLVAQGRAANNTSASPEFIGALYHAVTHVVSEAVYEASAAANEELLEATYFAAVGLAQPHISHSASVSSDAVLDQR
jgi:hypothetical protein